MLTLIAWQSVMNTDILLTVSSNSAWMCWFQMFSIISDQFLIFYKHWVFLGSTRSVVSFFYHSEVFSNRRVLIFKLSNEFLSFILRRWDFVWFSRNSISVVNLTGTALITILFLNLDTLRQHYLWVLVNSPWNLIFINFKNIIIVNLYLW